MLLTHALMEAVQKQPMYRPGTADKFARQMRHVEQLATHVSTPPPAGAVPEPPAKPASEFVAPPPPAKSRPVPVVITVPEPAVSTAPDPTPMPAVERPPEPVRTPVLFEESVSEPVRIVTQKPVSRPAPIIEPKPVREPVSLKESVPEPRSIVESKPARETVSAMNSIADALPVVEPKRVRETVSLRDRIPDPIPIVQPEPVSTIASLTDSIPDPLPIVLPEPMMAAATIAGAEPVVEFAREESNRSTRRSRLKTWKKKLHAMSASISHAPQHEKASNTVDIPEITRVEAPEIPTVETPAEIATVETPIEVTTVDAPVHATTSKPPVVAASETPVRVPKLETPLQAAPAKSPAIEIPIELTTLEMPAELTAVRETARVERKVDASAKVAAANETPVSTPEPVIAKAAELPPQVIPETRQTKTETTAVRRKAAKRSAGAAAPTLVNAPTPDASIKRNAPPPSKAASTPAAAPDRVVAQIDNRPAVKPAVASRTSAPEIASFKAPVIPPVAERTPEPNAPIVMDPPRLVVEERVVHATPKKIQWDQPDDDIPSEADVLDVLVKEGVIDESRKYTGHVFTVSTPQSADGPITAAPRSMNPPPPVVPPKSADGPVRTAESKSARSERPVPSQSRVNKPALRVEANPREANAKAAPRPVPPSVVDQEEITLVRPPRQIRINLDQQVPQNIYAGGWTPPRPTPDTDFFPTLLGERDKPLHIQPQPSEAMFSTYYSVPVKRTAIPYRTVMFGGGVLVLIVTFLIGDGFVGDHVQSKNESVVSKSRSAPRAKKVVPPINMKLDKPREEGVVDENELKPLPDNDRLTRTVIDKPNPVTKTAAVKKDTPKSATRDYNPAPRPVPRPTPADSQNSRDPIQQTRVIGIKSAPPKTNPNIATRPRIVKVPK